MTVSSHAAADADPDEPRFSALLKGQAQLLAGERVSLGQLLDGFGRRGHGALLVVLGAPNLIPLPLPGLSLISGLPLLILSFQVCLGRPAPWLPNWLRTRTLDVAAYQRVTSVVSRRLEGIEWLVRPRLTSLTTGWGRLALGLLGFVLALMLCLPLPLGNALPGLALALIGLALLERDGVTALVAAGVGLAGMAFVTLAGAAVAGAVVLVLQEVLPWLTP